MAQILCCVIDTTEVNGSVSIYTIKIWISILGVLHVVTN